MPNSWGGCFDRVLSERGVSERERMHHRRVVSGILALEFGFCAAYTGPTAELMINRGPRDIDSSILHTLVTLALRFDSEHPAEIEL